MSIISAHLQLVNSSANSITYCPIGLFRTVRHIVVMYTPPLTGRPHDEIPILGFSLMSKPGSDYLPGAGLVVLLPGTVGDIPADPEGPLVVLRPLGPGCG